jgi:hypothetical protein
MGIEAGSSRLDQGWQLWGRQRHHVWIVPLSQRRGKSLVSASFSGGSVIAVSFEDAGLHSLKGLSGQRQSFRLTGT